jgi:hypothetical protein
MAIYWPLGVFRLKTYVRNSAEVSKSKVKRSRATRSQRSDDPGTSCTSPFVTSRVRWTDTLTHETRLVTVAHPVTPLGSDVKRAFGRGIRMWNCKELVLPLFEGTEPVSKPRFFLFLAVLQPRLTIVAN